MQKQTVEMPKPNSAVKALQLLQIAEACKLLMHLEEKLVEGKAKPRVHTREIWDTQAPHRPGAERAPSKI